MRLFVGIGLPAAARDELHRTIRSLAPSLPDAKWVPAENLHLTIAFLGEVAEDRLAEITDALRDGVGEIERFAARLEGSGAFPSARRARVLWAGLRAEEGRLEDLAGACIRALEAVGFPAEARPWAAHVTVARLRQPASAEGILPLAIRSVDVPLEEITVFRSRLRRPAPVYEAVARVPLGG